jgi:lipocalin
MTGNLSPFCLGGNLFCGFFVFYDLINYNIYISEEEKDSTMSTGSATPGEFFLGRSPKKKEPNFKKLIAEAIDLNLLEERNKDAKGKRVQTH